MHCETMAIYSGYDTDPTTRSVAVPIYQTVAYAFDSADHGAALFNLESRGISLQPHQQSDHRGAGAPRRRARGRRRGAVRELPGRRRCNYAMLNLTDVGQQHRFRAAALRHDAHAVRPCAAEPGHQRPICRIGPARGHREADRRQTPRPCFARASAIPPATSATSRRWPRSRIGTAFR